MKLLTSFLNKSIKFKILSSMLLLAVCMIFAYMMVSITYSGKILYNSFVQSSLQDLTSAQNNTDNLLSIIENYSVILATDNTISSALTYTDKPEGSVLSGNEILLRNQINNIVGTFPRIDAVLICDTYGNIYDSGVTVISGTDTWKKLTSSRGWQNTAPAPYYISVIGGSIQPDVICYTCPIYNWRSGAFLGHLSIFINETYVKQLYAPAENEDSNMFLLSYNDVIVSAKDSSRLYTAGPVTIKDMIAESDHISTENHYYIYKDYPSLQCYFVKEISKQVIQRTINYMKLFMTTIGAVLAVATTFISILIARRLTRDILKLSITTEQIKNGNWDSRIECSSHDEIGVLAQNFNSMIEEIKDTTERLVNEQRLKREYQLELLNQQINPHFLYNTLDNICSLSELGYSKEVTDLVTCLSNFYRGVLSKGSLIIPLYRELEIASNYLRIMQMRYYNTFSVQIDIPEEQMNNSILRLTLQPILENAICHGLEYHRPGGVIKISSQVVRENLCLYIEDNGIGMSPEQVSLLLTDSKKSNVKEGFALKNINNRLELYYGSEYGLKVESKQDIGTKITITLPHISCLNTKE